MPQVKQIPLLEAVTADGNGPSRDVRNLTTMSVYVKGTGGTTANVKFQVTADPTGQAGWTDAAFRQPGGGTYAITPVAVTPAAPKSFFFDPADNIVWIRAVVSGQTGPVSLTAYLTGEV
jgi:hypothetical protein